MPIIPKPSAEEAAPYYFTYISLTGADAITTLEGQAASTQRLIAATSEERGAHRYAEGKWSVKEVLGHICDTERVFAYRALRFARADEAALPGFDENRYVPMAGSNARTLADLAAELAAVRAASLALFRSFDEVALLRIGTASGNPMSVRAAAHVIAGHEAHHVAILRERYGLKD